MRPWRLLYGGALVACLATTGRAQGPVLVERVSLTSLGEQGELASLGAAISGDGRSVAFASSAPNLVPGDRNGANDVFVRDRVSGRTTRVSVSSSGAEADDWSYNPALSGDGRFVAFESDATNLVPGDSNGFLDVFVHDRLTQQTRRVSVGSHGTQSDLPCHSPAISADGTTVAFQSYATTLAPGGSPGLQDVFVHVLATGETTRVSVTPQGVHGNGSSWAPSLSGDGRFVAFSSHASNLVPNDVNGAQDVFVYDRALGLARLASVNSAGKQATSTSVSPSISGDGRYVAFVSWAKNLVHGDQNSSTDVFVHDRTTGKTVRASVSSAGVEADNHSGRPRLSWTGRYVAFDSYAENLVADDSNVQQDVFLHDLHERRTFRASTSETGEQGNVLSLIPDLSADGSTVVFESHASNLVSGDTNSESDVFAVELH